MVIIGNCPVCGKYLKITFGKHGHQNYTTCLICDQPYCFECARYKLCPTHFSNINPMDQNILATFYERTVLIHRIILFALIPVYFIFGIIIFLLWMNVLITLIYLIALIVYYMSSGYILDYLYKKKVIKLSWRTIV